MRKVKKQKPSGDEYGVTQNQYKANGKDIYKDDGKKKDVKKKTTKLNLAQQRKHKQDIKKYSKCCVKVAQSKHCSCWAELYLEYSTFLWNKQSKKFMGTDPITWSKMLLVLIWTGSIVCSLSISLAICWPPISDPSKVRSDSGFVALNADGRLPYSFMHFPAYFSVIMKKMIIDLGEGGRDSIAAFHSEMLDAVKLDGFPMQSPGVNWKAIKTSKDETQILDPDFGPCSNLSKSRIEILASKGELCIYLALQRVYPNPAMELQFECETRVRKKDNFGWEKNGRNLNFTFYPSPFKIPKNFFNFDIYLDQFTELESYKAPGIAIHVSNIEINNTYAIQCRYKKVFAMCPNEFQSGGSLLTRTHGGFMAEIGLRATEQDLKRITD